MERTLIHRDSDLLDVALRVTAPAKATAKAAPSRKCDGNHDEGDSCNRARGRRRRDLGLQRDGADDGEPPVALGG